MTAAVAAVQRRNPLDLWLQWDARWYTGIAEHGYHWGIHGKPAAAFFPLLPLLIRLGMDLGLPAIAAGLLDANAAFFGALFYLHRWLAPLHPQTAQRTIWLLTFFPTGFFFAAPYAESLLLLCVAATFYHVARGSTWKSAPFVAAGLLTRPTGLVLLPIALWGARWAETWVNDGEDGNRDDTHGRDCSSVDGGQRRRYSPYAACAPASSRSWILQELVVLLSAAGAVAVYLWYLSTQHIALSTFLTAQRSWHRSLTFPWTGFTASLHWAVAHGASNPPWAIEDLLQLAVTVVFLAVTAVAWRDMGRPARLYCIGFWALVLLTPEWRDGYYAPFSSMDRFVLLLIPLFVWAAQKTRTAWFRPAIAIGGALMVGAASVHLSGGWVG